MSSRENCQLERKPFQQWLLLIVHVSCSHTNIMLVLPSICIRWILCKMTRLVGKWRWDHWDVIYPEMIRHHYQKNGDPLWCHYGEEQSRSIGWGDPLWCHYGEEQSRSIDWGDPLWCHYGEEQSRFHKQTNEHFSNISCFTIYVGSSTEMSIESPYGVLVNI